MTTLVKKPHQGFTLLEAIIVIAITGIIAAVVAVFIVKPVQGYVDSARRAEMTDTADTALRRISRDLHLALPNSVRVSPDNLALEFLSTRTGGRYRVGGPGDALNFNNASDTSFEIFGPSIPFQATSPENQNEIVIYNLGITGADAYAGNTAATHNRRPYNGATGSVSTVVITSSNPFPFDSPAHRFQVVDTPVSYICDLSAGTLTRYWGYVISSTQSVPPSTTYHALLAKKVSACAFIYTPLTERNGLVTMRLSIAQSGETITLYHEVHVNNVP
ncbi:prepilin-type N-terminal cleavage/methylation domain-containing protein [Noviherbaspirillum sp.]|uniref:prepilin-type N-terminal cleavage/methylation domain-containing protein n=1 Tax=Noviherbaspirillum sp. TaxID=1926288 RepID=UPI002B49ACDC|nr:prepilin-type N-terminal cleavage/methylation domain-containing protein [Noviherbaspirillum sp.]HJV83171.1 prepilin-type N-terminal cleavage/methylation domain-containing protein [Noviherbaspirillum sp.]